MNTSGVRPETLKRWLNLQETFSRQTGFEVALYNENAEAVAPASGIDPFCAEASSGANMQACRAFCRGIILTSSGQERPQFFRCPSGQLLFVLPVVFPEGEKLVVVGGKHVQEAEAYRKLREIAERDPGENWDAQSGRLGRESGERALLEPFVERLKQDIKSLFEPPGATGGLIRPNVTGERLSGQMVFMENIALLGQGEDDARTADVLFRDLCRMFSLETASLMLSEGREKGFRVVSFFGGREKAGLISDDEFTGEIERWHRSGGGLCMLEDRGELARMGLPPEVHSLFSLPVTGGGGAFGAVNVFNRKFTKEETQAFMTNVGLVSMVLENGRLRDSINETVGRIKGLCELSSSLCAQPDAEEIFKYVLEKSTEMLEAEQGSLMLINEKTEELAIHFSKGLDEELTRRLRLKPGQGIAGQVASRGEPLFVQDIEKDERLWSGTAKNRASYKTKSFISIPLRLENRVVGVLNVSDKKTGRPFSANDLEILSTIASQASVAMERSVYMHRMEEFRRLSITDPLTGLLNRRYFNGRLVEEFERTKRYGHHLSLAMVDIDDFKYFNDKHGHKAGDFALNEISALLKKSVRSHDVVARYGGEEFTLILPETDNDTARPLLERIKTIIADHRMPIEGKLPGNRITVSIGLASFPDDAARPEELLDHADIALYQAKRLGKNMVVNYRDYKSEALGDGFEDRPSGGND